MTRSLKFGVSAIALLAATSLAQAQTTEHQGAGAANSEHSSGGRGGTPAKSSEMGGGGETGKSGAKRARQVRTGRAQPKRGIRPASGPIG